MYQVELQDGATSLSSELRGTESYFERKIKIHFTFIQNKLSSRVKFWDALQTAGDLRYRKMTVYAAFLLSLSRMAGYLSLSWLMAIYAICDHSEEKNIHILKMHWDRSFLSWGHGHARRKEVEFPRSWFLRFLGEVAISLCSYLSFKIKRNSSWVFWNREFGVMRGKSNCSRSSAFQEVGYFLAFQMEMALLARGFDGKRYGWNLMIRSTFRQGMKIKYSKPKISVIISQDTPSSVLGPGV